MLDYHDATFFIQPYSADIVYAGIATIIALFIWSWRSTRRGLESVVAALRQAEDLLLAAGDRRNLPVAWEQVDAELGRLPIVGRAWRRFSSTLLLPTDPGRPVRQTEPPENFFTGDLMNAAGLWVRWHRALPNVLVGIGLLFTFFGLIIALGSAGDSVGAANPEASRGALKGLLDAASLKFMSSLFGLGCSIWTLTLHRRQDHRLDKEIAALCLLIDERMPHASALDMTRATNDLLSRLLASQETFASDIAVKLGEQMNEGLGRTLGEKLDEILGAQKASVGDLVARNVSTTMRQPVFEIRLGL